MPLWRHAGCERWLYFGTDNQWYVGGADEFVADFACCKGYIRHAGAELPHEARGPWERFNTKTDAWVKDTNVVVAVAVA